eukprot:2652274-Rhodomonas_salina.3
MKKSEKWSISKSWSKCDEVAPTDFVTAPARKQANRHQTRRRPLPHHYPVASSDARKASLSGSRTAKTDMNPGRCVAGYGYGIVCA